VTQCAAKVIVVDQSSLHGHAVELVNGSKVLEALEFVMIESPPDVNAIFERVKAGGPGILIDSDHPTATTLDELGNGGGGDPM